MRFDGILLTHWRTVAGIVLGSICSECEFAARVGVDKPLFAARVAREKRRFSIHWFSDTSGARRQDGRCGVSPECKFTGEPEFEYYAVGYYWVVGEWTFKAGQPVRGRQLVRLNGEMVLQRTVRTPTLLHYCIFRNMDNPSTLPSVSGHNDECRNLHLFFA